MTDQQLHVTKRKGDREPIDLDKIHKVLDWATQDITGVSVSEIEIRSHIQFYDGIRTKDIHETLIRTAADLISEETPNYQYVASRLIIFGLRKEVYGHYETPTIRDHVIKMVELKKYDQDLLHYYDDEEWDALDKIINHERDYLLTYAAIEQFRGKYLVQDRTKGLYFETPQMAYLLIAATLFHNYPKDARLDYVKRYYNAISKGPKSTITVPTPILAGVRTPTRQFSSCVLIETGDSLESINETATSIVNYASRRAGIGINAGRIRAKGSAVRGGEIFHTGNIPFYKYFHAALKSCSQGGIRGASSTVYYPLWHYEIEDLIVLKNNKGTEETRVRHMDYGVQINGFLYKRLLEGKEITLFSPNDVPGLYDAFFEDQSIFAELYEQYELNPNIRQQKISALDLFNLVLTERNNTGRIYIQNVDHTNEHGQFKNTSPVRMSNLCTEITLPTEPLTSLSNKPATGPDFDMNADEFREKYGEIALCTLSSLNLAMMTSDAEIENAADLAVRSLDELLSYQDYPMVAAEVPAINRRSLGIGVCNVGYVIAKHGLKYSDGSANQLIHDLAERIAFNLTKASVQLAKEKGACKWFSETKYSEGILPIDTYKSAIDEKIEDPSLKCDWDSLRADVRQFGMRNSVVMALMPVETSSQIINATNGIEPARSVITVKTSKDGALKQVVPGIRRLKNKYEYLWDMPQTRGYLEVAAAFQKFVDQSISVNTHYNPINYSDSKVPMSELLKDLFYAYKIGHKCLYYQNTDDGSGETDWEKESDSCESCKL